MYMKYIQSRFLHYRVATKYENHEMNIIDSDKCTFLKNKKTVVYLLYRCEQSMDIWSKMDMLIRSLGLPTISYAIKRLS